MPKLFPSSYAKSAKADQFLELWNCSRSVLLAHSVDVAASRAARNKGLLGRAELVWGHGLWIVPCRAIHTIGLRFAIDLIFLDRSCRILKICHSVPGWRVAASLLAHSVVELAAGTLAFSQLEVGDLLAFRSLEPITMDRTLS